MTPLPQMEARIVEEQGRLTESVEVAVGCRLQEIEAPRIAAAARPGQFVMIRPGPGFDPLLRRPLGILQRSGSRIRLFFQVLGRGTAFLAAKRPGEAVDLLGPLGRPFPADLAQKILLVAGGRGIVPLFFFASETGGAKKLQLAYGGRRRQDLHLLKLASGLPLERLHPFTEDGSHGRRGLVTDGLPEQIAAAGVDAAIACGPEGMLNSFRDRLHGCPVDAGVVLEARMGCGFGICHSCAVAAAGGGYRKVCEEGPFFRLPELQWPI